jgi:hypothetical protein
MTDFYIFSSGNGLINGPEAKKVGAKPIDTAGGFHVFYPIGLSYPDSRIIVVDSDERRANKIIIELSKGAINKGAEQPDFRFSYPLDATQEFDKHYPDVLIVNYDLRNQGNGADFIRNMCNREYGQ